MISMKKVALWFGLFLLAFWLAFVPGFGTVSRAIGPTVAATGDLPVAVKVTPRLSEAWSQYLSGNIYEALSQLKVLLGIPKLDEVNIDLLQTVTPNRENLQAMILLGQIYTGQGKFEAARQVFRRVENSQLQPENNQAQLGLLDVEVKELQRSALYTESSLSKRLALCEKVKASQEKYQAIGQSTNLVIAAQAQLAEFRLLAVTIPKLQAYFIELPEDDSIKMSTLLVSGKTPTTADRNAVTLRNNINSLLRNLIQRHAEIPPMLDRINASETETSFRLYWSNSLESLVEIFKNLQAIEQRLVKEHLQTLANAAAIQEKGLTPKAKPQVQPSVTFTPQELQLSLQRIAQSSQNDMATALQRIALETDNPRIKAAAFQKLAKLYPDKASRLQRQALKLSGDDAFIRAHVYRDQAQVLAQSNNYREACDAYDVSIKAIQALRQNIVAIDRVNQYDFRDGIEPIYREGVLACLRADDRSPQGLEQVRQYVEDLQLAELDNFFGEACVEARKVNIDQVLDRKSPNTALIYPIISENRLDVIVKIAGQAGLKDYPTNFSPEQYHQFQQNIETLNKLLRNTDTPTLYAIQTPAQEIYTSLIKNIEQALAAAQVKTLVFVLDGPLRSIPMSILYDGDGQQYLFQKYAIALSPGLQLFQPQVDRFAEQFVLAGGLKGDSKLGALDTDTIIKNITRHVERKKLAPPLIDNQFTEAVLREKINPTNPGQALQTVIHLSTHANFDSNAQNTFILAAEGKHIDANTFSEILNQRAKTSDHPIELLVMSACETAEGDSRSPLGLSALAVRSGVKTTIGTLQKIRVKDVPMLTLVDSLYENLSAGLGKAEALRVAQQKALQAASTPEQGLQTLSAFVLVGDWL
jgi:CHAT domain-containing protein